MAIHSDIDFKEQAAPQFAPRILVVDDDTEVSGTIVNLLVSLRCRAVSCKSAHEALERLKSEKFDLILTDYRMPEMSGLDLILTLKGDGHQMPVILMTGYSATEDRILVKNTPHYFLLRKPIAFAQLTHAVKASFNRPDHCGATSRASFPSTGNKTKVTFLGNQEGCRLR